MSQISGHMKQFVREPLFHFLLLGGLMFAAYARWGVADKAASSSDEILVSAAQEKRMAAAFERVWQRAPTADELQRLIDDYVRDEVYVREALKLGLDQDDSVIRQRLRQKMEFLGDDAFKPPTPTDAELETFLEDNPAWFSQDAEFTFRHIYFNPEQRGDKATADAEAALAGLTKNDGNVDPNSLGDSFVMGQEFRAASATFVSRIFGDAFVKSLRGLKPGGWYGPISSNAGLHLVKVESIKEGQLPPLSAVRDAVLAEWTERRRAAANETFYQSLRKKYSVRVEPMSVETVASKFGDSQK